MKIKLHQLLILLFLFQASLTFCQSNDKGTVELGMGTWLTVGNANIKNSFDNLQDVKGSGIGVNADFGIMAQYGFSEKISGGVFIRRSTAIYSTSYTYNDQFFTPTATDISAAGFSFGTEIKYYINNTNFYNFYVCPMFGYYTGNATLKLYSAEGNLNGIIYGIGGGFNWYWGYNIGMSMDFGIHGQSLKGTPDSPESFNQFNERVTVYKINGVGLLFGLGINIKFDRESKNTML